jgi:hypothetical protein
MKMGRRLGKRVGGSAYWRIGVWGSKTTFRHGCNDQEVSTKLTTLCKRRHADSPIRRYVPPSRRPILIATIYLLFRGQDTRIALVSKCELT